MNRPSTIPYFAAPSGLAWLKKSKGQQEIVPLTNFVARIGREIIEEDGLEQHRFFEIDAVLPSGHSHFRIPAADFAKMTWVLKRLGAEAIVTAGQGNRDHARAAIQYLSGNVATQTIYTHTGWTVHNQQPVYLHAGGAIGSEGEIHGVGVELAGPIVRYRLPSPPSGRALGKAVQASLKLLEVAALALTVPLFAAIYLAVLGAAGFAIHLTGRTGEGKTALAILAMQHFGAELDAAHIPGNWSSTANANEELAFAAKDALFLVDDFAPGPHLDSSRLNRDADRLLRNQGNMVGRARMRSDASLRPTKGPRGLIISTGEDIPLGESLRARMLILELSAGIDWKKLTVLQKEAAEGKFAASLAGYIQWIAHRHGDVQSRFVEERKKSRTDTAGSGLHKRTPETVAKLFFAFNLFTEFAEESGALSSAKAIDLRRAAWDALDQAASAQVVVPASAEPTQRFLNYFGAALMACKAHVANRNGTVPPNAARWGWRSDASGISIPCGDRVGWVDGSDLFLEPEIALNVARSMAQDVGEPLTISNLALRKRLDEKGLLVTVDSVRQRLTIRRTLDGEGREVLHLQTRSLGPLGT